MGGISAVSEERCLFERVVGITLKKKQAEGGKTILRIHFTGDLAKRLL